MKHKPSNIANTTANLLSGLNQYHGDHFYFNVALGATSRVVELDRA